MTQGSRYVPSLEVLRLLTINGIFRLVSVYYMGLIDVKTYEGNDLEKACNRDCAILSKCTTPLETSGPDRWGGMCPSPKNLYHLC